MTETPRQPRRPIRWKNSSVVRGPPSRHLVSLLIVSAVLLLLVLISVAGDIEKWLWMRQLDYAGIFWILLSIQWAMFSSAFAFAFLYLYVNLHLAARKSADSGGAGSAGHHVLFAGNGQIGIGLPPRLLKLA